MYSTSPGRGRAVQQQGEAHNNRLLLTLGTDGHTKMDEFSEKMRKGGGGVIFNPKIYFADFGPSNRAI